ncbi:hypothetical protein [Vibrio owensii]|uniref:hypothetical protein n=1 Tax=Vibrio owensii TaxID=696485 RepID=UPI003CC57F9F
MNFTSENKCTLYTRSMRKIFKVEAITTDRVEAKKLFKTKDLVCVSHIPGLEGFELLAGTYSGLRNVVISDRNSEAAPLTHMYLKTQRGVYQVAAIHGSEKESMDFESRRLNTTLMDTLTLKSGVKLYVTTENDESEFLTGEL